MTLEEAEALVQPETLEAARRAAHPRARALQEYATCQGAANANRAAHPRSCAILQQIADAWRAIAQSLPNRREDNNA